MLIQFPRIKSPPVPFLQGTHGVAQRLHRMVATVGETAEVAVMHPIKMGKSAVVVRAVEVEGKRSPAWLEPITWRGRVVLPAPVVPVNMTRE